ncbi:MAG: signal recognition particle protein, partial [Bacteroidales bacterium]|nr:signal recognition particle protein [Bacteroidales bacterium]
EARKLQKKLIKDQFTLSDFYDQIQQIKKMGNIKDLASMLPGVGKMLKDVDIDNSAFKGIEAIILSMTPYERNNPSIINGSRRRRIAEGIGTSVTEVNRLLKQFEDTRIIMKTMAGGGAQKAMRAMGSLKRRR